MGSTRRVFLKTTAAVSAGGILGAIADNASAETMPSEFQWWSIRRVSTAYERREISSVELTTLMLERVRTIDAELHSFLTVMADEALAMARLSDERIERGASRGLLEGVPIAVKDLCYTKGVKTTNATAVLADFVPSYDGTVVKKLKSSGAVILGKLNQTEGAMAGYNRKFPYPKNPWNRSVWPGVSSSGSGVAAAAGLAYGTIGTDTGGSIRYPAASCGVVGLKPTWGRVSRYGVFPLAESLDHVGPIARSTEDCAIMLEAISGYDPNDPTTLPSPAPTITDHMGRGVKRLRLGWDEKFAGEDTHPDVFAALSEAVQTLKDCGANVQAVRVPSLRGYQHAWNVLCATEAVIAHSKFYPHRRDEYGPWFQAWLDFGSRITGTEYASAVHRRNECTGTINKLFEDIDVLILPSMEQPAFKVTRESQYGPIPDGWFDGDYVRIVGVFNFSGSPTLSLPCGFSKEGLPVSMQLVGRLGREDAICQVGHAFEQATQFHERHPQVK